MTDKQIIIKEITECGFYCSKDDTERLYIYEVIKNTDEEWLKENPEATLLIDEWIYDYTDYDDRKVYCASGNLIAVCNDSSNCKVYKIEDTKYKIYGNCGQFLIEDKPTYKEQLKRKEQECDQFKAENEELKKEIAFGNNGTLSDKIRAEVFKELNNENKQLSKTLAKIKEIADKDFRHTAWEEYAKQLKQILQKISECEAENAR